MFITVCTQSIVGPYSEPDKYDTLPSYFCKEKVKLPLNRTEGPDGGV
jgi:hypothetical protein